MLKNFILICYIGTLHILILIGIFKPNWLPRFQIDPAFNSKNELSIIQIMANVHQQVDPNVPAETIVFLGDSITMGLATSAIAPFTVNYGIAGLRTDQLLNNMHIYESLNRAKLAVITIGTNDLLQGLESGIEDRYKQILSKIPLKIPVIMSSIPPIDIETSAVMLSENKILSVVDGARRACEEDNRCTFINTYRLLSNQNTPLPGVLLDDGIHLSKSGYQLWIDSIRHTISSNDSKKL